MLQASAFLTSCFKRREQNLQGFKNFVEQLQDVLKRSWIPHDIQVLPLHEYLARVDASGSVEGDEQSVVDELARKIIHALGYSDSSADYSYNRLLPGKGHRRPDFSIYVRDFFPSKPVFVIENKSTSVRNFRVKRGATDESALDQLRRYVRSGGVYGCTGILCNGRVMEAWQFGAEGDSRILQLDLCALSRHFADHPSVKPPPFQEGALHTLWSRFSRAAFADTDLDSREMMRVPSMPLSWIERAQQSLSGNQGASAYRELANAYHEEVWRNTAIGVKGDSETLVKTIRVLIDEFSDDVLYQLNDALAGHAAYTEASKKEIAEADLDALWSSLGLQANKFDIEAERFANEILAPIKTWRDTLRVGEVRRLSEQCRQRLSAHVRPPAAEQHIQRQMFGDGEQNLGGISKAQMDAHKKKVLDGFEQSLLAYCNKAAELERDRVDLELEHRPSIAVYRAFSTWVQRISSSVMVNADDKTLRQEFARQTAYVYIVRLLLVRICEDKGLFQRKLSDGGLVEWCVESARFLDYASGRSYAYLTNMAYECAQNVYMHFYGASQIFDWYRMDDKILFRALAMLNAFNLAHIDTDIIGAVYGRYLEEGKHEQGRYYTPRPLVNHMLDMAGYKDKSIVGRRIADLACGSGSFLVEAARRLLNCYRGPDGHIPAEHLETALEEIQSSIYGLDINPFACYLAETNLLIQVLDLIRQAQREGLSFTIKRFSVYVADTLLVNEDLTLIPGAAFALSGEDDAHAELLKAKAHPFADGFDYLVGNPPYVRADEDAPLYLAYRSRVQAETWFTTKHLKWDLYVPFVEQYCRLLAGGEGSGACLITIESLGTAPYASKLRDLLTRQHTLKEVLFLEGLKLFEDAAWQNNIVFSFSVGTPPDKHEVKRSIVQSMNPEGIFQTEALDSITQANAEPDRIFNKRAGVTLDLENTVRWDEICYVSKGMVLHSSEKLAEGQIVLVPPSYDPIPFGEELIEPVGEHGKRIKHKSFGRDDLVAETRDSIHTRPYIGSREVLRGGIGRRRWLEYGEHTRCPARTSRPTFPELYDRPKIMFGTFTGVAVDEGLNSVYAVVSHSLTVALRWTLLSGIDNRALKDARKELESDGRYHPDLSLGFSEWYLCALALSEPIQAWLHANRRSMKDHVYPDDIKAIPIKRIDQAAQKPFVDLERERHRLWEELGALEAQGYKMGAKIELPVEALLSQFRIEHPKGRWLGLLRASAAGFLVMNQDAAGEDLGRVKAEGDKLRIGRIPVAQVGHTIVAKEAIAQILARILAARSGPWSDRLEEPEIPADEKLLLQFGRWLAEKETSVREKQERIKAIGLEIDRMAWELYRPKR